MGRLCATDQFFQCGIFSAESEDGDDGVAVYGLSGVGGVFYAAAFRRFVYTGSALGILCPVHVTGSFNRFCRRQVFCCAASVGCRVFYFRWGAEVATSLQPFSIGITFVLWLIISPSAILVYLREPFVALLIVAAMAGIVVSVRLFNRSPISMQALKFLVLTLTVGAFCDIVNKKVMNYGQGDLVSASYFYVLLIALVAGAINLVVYLRDNGSLKKTVAAENVKYLPVFVLLIGCNVSKNFAMFYALNPSYVAALMYIYILWIALFNLLKARLTPNVPYNRMNVKAALLLLTSAIVLILASG
mgnify:CR=1 FL=1